MLFQYASDLHLEFEQNRTWLEQNPLKPSAPILFLAGDIDVLKNREVSQPSYFQWLSDNWEQVYIIPGNHEFYGTGLLNEALHFNMKVHSNAQYINNTSLIFGGTEVFFTTLWSHCSTRAVEKRIADFRYCKWGNEKYSFTHHTELHHSAVEWLDQAISKSTADRKIIVSHFVPCPKVDRYPSGLDAKSLVFKEYFVARMHDYIQKWKADYWIYGHNHWNNDMVYEGTQFLSNMLGYCMTGEQHTFQKDKTVSV